MDEAQKKLLSEYPFRVACPLQGEVFLFFWVDTNNDRQQHVYIARKSEHFEREFVRLWKKHRIEVTSSWHGYMVGLTPEMVLEMAQKKEEAEIISWRNERSYQIAYLHQANPAWNPPEPDGVTKSKAKKIKDFWSYQPKPNIFLPAGVSVCSEKTESGDTHHNNCPRCFQGYILHEKPWRELWKEFRNEWIAAHRPSQDGQYAPPSRALHPDVPVMVVADGIDENVYGNGYQLYEKAEHGDLISRLSHYTFLFLFQGIQIVTPKSIADAVAAASKKASQLREEAEAENKVFAAFDNYSHQRHLDAKKFLNKLKEIK